MNEVTLKLIAVVADDFIGARLSDYLHLPRMTFASDVAFESIFISALLLADLTVPAEPLKALRF